MKVWEWAETFRIIGKNPPVIVKVETEELMNKYGTTYCGEFIKYAGVNGRLNDIPVWLGNCDIRHIDEDVMEYTDLSGNKVMYTIYL